MKLKVIKNQNVAKCCVMCGKQNPFGLHAEYWELENGWLYSEITPKEHHQSYPNRMHGGLISAVLDELVGRAVQIQDPSIWGVTAELTTRFLKPVPLNQKLYALGKITNNASRMFVGEGILVNPETNEILAKATAKYFKMPVEKIVGGSLDDDEWHCSNVDFPNEVVILDTEW